MTTEQQTMPGPLQTTPPSGEPTMLVDGEAVSVSPELLAAAENVDLSPAPDVKPPLQIFQALTPAERSAIRAQARVDDQVADWWESLLVAREVDPADPLTLQGVALIVSKGLMTQQRAQQILGA